MNRSMGVGIVVFLLIAAGIYFSSRSERAKSYELKPFRVKLLLSDQVKKDIEKTHAGLSVRAIVTDGQDLGDHTELHGSPMDLREEVLKPGQDTVEFYAKRLDFEPGPSSAPVDPTLTLQIVSRLDQPSGNCIRCETPVVKMSTLKKDENLIQVRCDGWIEFGVCAKSHP